MTDTDPKRCDSLEFDDFRLEMREECHDDKFVSVATFNGKVTNDNSYELNRKFHLLFNRRIERLVLDLTALSYVNSTGVAILFSIFFRIQESGGEVAIGGLHPFLRRVFSLMDLPPRLKVYETCEEAVRSI